MDEQHSLLDRMVEVFKALGDPSRLRILGLLAERARSGTELAETLGLGLPTVSHHLTKLAAAGLVTVTKDGQSRIFALNEAALQTLTKLIAAREAAAGAIEADGQADDSEARERAKTIRDFFDGPRLKQIPAQRKKRVIVLQHLLLGFEPNRDYPEKEVNGILKVANDDVATLRRELVNYGFMTREGGVYRVAQTLPQRTVQIGQEITGDENAWLRTLLSRATS